MHLCRKYASMVILILMSMFVVTLVVDELGDQHRLQQDLLIEACMEIEIEDIEWDDADEFSGIGNIQTFINNIGHIYGITLCPSDNINSVAMQSDEHRLGLVRRYAPRKNIANYNYILT